MEYGAIAATSWIVDTGASYDSAPAGLAERAATVHANLEKARAALR